MVVCTKICCGVVLLGEGLVLLCLAVGDSDRDLRVPPVGLVRVPPPATHSPIRPSFPQISHKDFVMRLAKQAAHCSHRRVRSCSGDLPKDGGGSEWSLLPSQLRVTVGEGDPGGGGTENPGQVPAQPPKV